MSRPDEPTSPHESHHNSDESTPPTTPYPGAPYPPEQPPNPAAARPNAFARHRTAILAGVVGLIVGGIVGGLISWGATDNDNHDTGAAAPAVAAPDHHQKPAKRAGRAIHGSITAINGDSWSVQAPGGTTVTVTINPKTSFGTAKKPEQASDFAVGDHIAAVGQRSGDTVTATRVVKTPVRSGPSAPSSSQPPSSQPG